MNESEQGQQGLYVPTAERDSCGVGLMADLKGEASHYILDSALQILENMEHRGACGCEENTGDGAGILVQIPHDFFSEALHTQQKTIPQAGKYGVGMFFLPRDAKLQSYCKEVITSYSASLDFKIIAERQVPVDNAELGQTALDSEPLMLQLFFQSTGFNYKDLERRFYLLRSSILKEIYDSDAGLRDEFYIASLSSKTIVYKGLLTAHQLRTYFSDLQDERFKSAVAIVHSRFSTNTTPKWKLAQPFRCIAHNGEINTIQGNINWWQAREQHVKKVTGELPEFNKVFPICDPFLSDSGNFDNVVDFLLRASRSIPHSIMMMIPEAWQNDREMPDYKKAFYEYHDAVMEPWDGPAAICFTDGSVLGATLDRNGLRPCRYLVTSDQILIVASEAGCLPVDERKIIKKGRLEPGKMLVADLDEKRIFSDKEVKDIICKRRPYRSWLDQNAMHIEDLESRAPLDFPTLPLQQLQLAFGMSQEDKKLIMDCMVANQKEPIGSMGADIPLAVLSRVAQHISHYFKQQFAQVTNPPIDPLREQFYMSLSTVIGGGSRLIGIGEREAKVIRFDQPILNASELSALINTEHADFRAANIPILFEQQEELSQAILRICEEARLAIQKGATVLCLSDRGISAKLRPLPSLLVVGGLHHYLIGQGIRKEVSILVDAGDIWEAHHMATLLSFGADLLSPYLALASCKQIGQSQGLNAEQAVRNYIKAANKALLKIMSKLGVSTLGSYKAAQTFEALGISQEVVDLCFTGTVTRIGGMSFEDLKRENQLRHKIAFSGAASALPDQGTFQWKRKGEYHLFNPTSIHLLQHSTRTNDYKVYKKFAATIDKLEQNSSTLRSYLRIKPGPSIPISEVESAEKIMKRFATGAMSFGSISLEAHSMLAIAMNKIGGKSNSGEGGEDENRFEPMENGDWKRSATKQVASGRFGVNINYLTNAEELQIKIAQGAKPGEGGQLPGHKVDSNIARVRNATPGVGLISPPPHHDIYSIEDLAQLIFDLKNANRKARISVKLVSKTGVGVIASGVTKAHADHILISGADGGTGASPLSSVRHAGLPWELGLSETHQTLIKNGLRDRVTLQTDGQIRTGRDLAVATMLGAEEWGIATAALVVEGCILMRKCHLNTCPVGIATQDKDLRKKFNGKVEHLLNYFRFLAEHLREIMAECGVRTVNELVGRTDLLQVDEGDRHWKTSNLDLSPILHRPANTYGVKLYCNRVQDHKLENIQDKKLIHLCKAAIQNDRSYENSFPVINTDRAIGAMLSNEIAKIYGSSGMRKGKLNLNFTGSAGQSFGAFAIKGCCFHLEGEANDHFGKGLSGATLSVRPPVKQDRQADENVIIGNVALYGATAGEAFISGIAGDRFCVRNSGAKTVVEGVGDNACEYMTGGLALILGKVGRNFAAGMSGGLAFIHNQHYREVSINQDMVLIESCTDKDQQKLHDLLQKHFRYTRSAIAKKLLASWSTEKDNFIKIIPEEYKAALARQQSFFKQSKAG